MSIWWNLRGDLRLFDSAQNYTWTSTDDDDEGGLSQPLYLPSPLLQVYRFWQASGSVLSFLKYTGAGKQLAPLLVSLNTQLRASEPLRYLHQTYRFWQQLAPLFFTSHIIKDADRSSLPKTQRTLPRHIQVLFMTSQTGEKKSHRSRPCFRDFHMLMFNIFDHDMASKMQ